MFAGIKSTLSKSRSTVECFPSTFEGLGACQIFPSMTFAYQLTKTFTITKLTKHKGKQLIPATDRQVKVTAILFIVGRKVSIPSSFPIVQIEPY